MMVADVRRATQSRFGRFVKPLNVATGWVFCDGLSGFINLVVANEGLTSTGACGTGPAWSGAVRLRCATGDSTIYGAQRSRIMSRA